MSYIKEDIIAATDLNTFLTTVNAVYGVGTGDKGYGQNTITQAAVSSTDVINAVHWTNLRTMITTCATHQGTVVTDLMPTSVLDVGDVITAHEQASPSSNAYDLNSYVTAIETNRLTANAGGMTLTTGAHTDAKSGTWDVSITGTYSVTFASEDAARYFFNAGGQVRIRFTHPSGTGDQNDAWRTIFTNRVGTLALSAYDFTCTGSQTAALSALGYYELTTTYQNVFNGASIGAGSYATNDVIVEARVQSVAGVRGGNGTVIQFRVTINDDYTTMGVDEVATGTTANFDVYRATGLSGISAPTFTTVDGL